MPQTRAIERLALFGSLLAAFGEIHPFCDHWAQGSETARCKRLYGPHPVYRDGGPVEAEDADRADEPTMTASARGRRAVALHVISVGQGPARPADCLASFLVSSSGVGRIGARQVSRTVMV
ncbi:hypothetical protein [Streptomyces malaysiensis]|uniref:Uncharacterized protein n=1 Tax=Streptomyces malaysiensis subsp. samsunensis TaxID=459658 RepID=A0A9X2RWZ2_STRMQ|nr:hypothetical protein [Streptomyces samsunensis]MCQ8833772.1 hypothetical protein [Streptomyces samsunensis]